MKSYIFLFIVTILNITSLIGANYSFADFETYQNTLSKEEVITKLATSLENNNSCKDYYTTIDDAFYLFASPTDKANNQPEFILKFGTKTKPTLPMFIANPNNPNSLAGLRIALDPGHLGGNMARTEERYIDLDIQTSEGIQTVQFDEGTLAVATAKILADLLKQYGATVLLTKDEPGKSVYPVDFKTWCIQQGLNSTNQDFRATYNQLDLTARSEKINAFAPHITLMIHYNGGDRLPNGKNIPTHENYCLTFTPGSFMHDELKTQANRYEFVRLLVTETIVLSEKLSTIVAQEMERELSVPLLNTPFYIPRATILRAPGVYARNLALTRKVHSPLCYGETLLQDNPEEALRLAQTDIVVDGILTSSRVVAVAKAYFKGICKFFGVKPLMQATN